MINDQATFATTFVANMSLSRFSPSCVSSLNSRGSPTAMVVVGRPWDVNYLVNFVAHFTKNTSYLVRDDQPDPAVQGVFPPEVLDGDRLPAPEE